MLTDGPVTATCPAGRPDAVTPRGRQFVHRTLGIEDDLTRMCSRRSTATAARPVIRTARSARAACYARVEALHVGEDGVSTARAPGGCGRHSRPFVDGDPTESIVGSSPPRRCCSASSAHGGARRGADRPGTRPLAIAQATKPLGGRATGQRASLPSGRECLWSALDGDARASVGRGTKAALLFPGADIEVDGPSRVRRDHRPAFWDQPHHATASWRHEFAARHLEHTDSALEVRGGRPESESSTSPGRVDADFVALCWSQNLSAGQAPDRPRGPRQIASAGRSRCPRCRHSAPSARPESG